MLEHRALTPAALNSILHSIVSATSDEQCTLSIATSAAMIQGAVLAGQPREEIYEVFDSCPPELTPALVTAMDRAVSVTSLEDGSSLVLWLLPVVLSSAETLPSVISLETSSLNGLKTAAYLQSQLELVEAGGWAYVLPSLFSIDQIHVADLGDLITLPHHAREVLRGERKTVKLRGEPDIEPSKPGVSLYFLPFVAFHPASVGIKPPTASERVSHRVTKWVTDTFAGRIVAERLAVHVAPAPQPFAEAISMGERMALDVRLREMVMRVCARGDVQPNGLAALVAPYVTEHMEDEFVLGISLVSRLTGAFVATVPLSVDSLDAQTPEHQEILVSMAYRILQEMGLQVIQLQREPIDTFVCQHCGNLQYVMPTLDAGVQESTGQLMH